MRLTTRIKRLKQMIRLHARVRARRLGFFGRKRAKLFSKFG